MSSIAAKPYVFKNGLVKIDADTFEKHVSGFSLVPTQSTVTWQAIVPAGAFADSTSPSWTCTVNYAQDWDTEGSLSQYLMDHAGETKTVEFTPENAGPGSTTFTVDLIIAPGPIGGEVNTVQVGSVSMGVVGEPVRGAAA